MILSALRPSPTLTDTELGRSLRLMIWEGVASGALFSLGSGGFMAAFALALGANNLQVGILAALPFITQVAQLPAILAVERFRTRKAIGIPNDTSSSVSIYLPDVDASDSVDQREVPILLHVTDADGSTAQVEHVVTVNP